MSVVAVEHINKTYNTYEKELDRFREAISLRHRTLHKQFVALEDVNFQLSRGECLGIIGTNGSGKSTLLKIITGVLQPTSGSVRVDGKVSALLELGAGFNPDYTGIDNIILNGKIMGYTEEEMKQRIPLIEEFAEIGEFIHRPVKIYSSGMFARLAFAVAINVDPDVLIIDEALSVGDIFFQTKCYRKFDEFLRQGKTILFVSHDLSSIIKYCNRCLLLNRGRQVALGDCKQVVDIYRKILVDQYDEDNGLASVSAAPAAAVDEAAGKADAAAPAEEGKTWKSAVLQNPNYVEYGDMDVSIEDFGIINDAGEVSSVIMKGSEYTVAIRFRFNRKVVNPIFAFTIKDPKGADLCGTNTMLEGKTIEDAEAGMTGVVKFRQVMRLQGGQYFLSLGITSFVGGELVVHHRLYDICHMQVVSDYNTIGVYDVESRVSYESIRR